MAIKYFVDEPDVGNTCCPLLGVIKMTQLFDSYEECLQVASEWSRGDVFYDVWSYDTETGQSSETTPPKK